MTAIEKNMFERLEEAARELVNAAATFLSHDSLAETLAVYREGLARLHAALGDGHN